MASAIFQMPRDEACTTESHSHHARECEAAAPRSPLCSTLGRSLHKMILATNKPPTRMKNRGAAVVSAPDIKKEELV